MEAKSIERIAEELHVNFYDLHPYILMREREAKREVVEWIEDNCGRLSGKWLRQRYDIKFSL